MLARHAGLLRFAFTKLGAQTLAAGFSVTRRGDNNRTGGAREGQAGVGFNRITTSTNIRDKILQCNSSEELFSVVSENSHLINPVNSAIALRALAKYLPSNPKLSKELKANPNFVLLMEKVLSGIEQLEIGGISDFCFILKRAEQRGVGLGLKQENYAKIQARIAELIKEKRFDDKSLFYLFFNSSDLGVGTDVVAAELLRIIREAPQQLTTIQIRNTLMCLANKRAPLTFNENMLALEIEKVLPEYLSGIEPSNKARIFRDLAALEFQYIAPRFRVSQSLNKLRADLKEGLESFNEDDVLLVLEAYYYLPAAYPNDLLDTFKEVMNNTIVHNPSAVKTGFLIKYLAHAAQLNRARRLSSSALNTIFSLIASRLKTESQMQREIEELAQYLLRINVTHQPLKTEILNHLKSPEAKAGYLKISCLEYLIRNSTPEVAKTIVKDVVTPDVIAKLNTTALRRVKAILEGTDEAGFKTIIDELTANAEFSKVENIRTGLFNGGFRNRQHDAAIHIVTGLFENIKTSGRPLNMGVFTTILNCIQNGETRKALAERPELHNLTPPQIGALLNSLFEQDSANDNQWLFVLDILKANAERVTPSRIISTLNNNGIKLIATANRSPKVIQNWAYFLASIPKIEEERINTLFPLLLRLTDAGLISFKLIEKLRIATDKCIKENIAINFSTQAAITEFLVEHDNCNFEIAQALFEKSQTRKYVDKSRIKIISYLYDRKQATPEQKESLLAVANEELKKLLTNLGSLDPKHVLEATSGLLLFPYPLIKDSMSAIQSAIKDHISYANSNSYTELISSISSTNHSRADLENYQPILKEIASQFATFAPKLRVSELIDVVESFAFSNFRGTSVYNTALTLVGSLFQRIRTTDLLRLLDSFSYVQLKHAELFEKITEKVLEDPSRLERDEIESLVRALFRVGYNGKHKSDPKLLDLVLSKKLVFTQNSHIALYYILASEQPNEAELLKKYFELVSSTKTPIRKSPYGPLAYRVAAYLKATYPNEKFAEAYEILLNDKPAEPFKIECSQSELIRSYLRSIGTEFEDSFELYTGIQGVYLTKQKTFVQFFSRQNYNYDFQTLRGASILVNKSNVALAKAKGAQYIYLNFNDLVSLPTDLDRVKYLTAKGVQPGKAAEEYDFSLVTKRTPDREESAETHSVEEIEAKKAAKKAAQAVAESSSSSEEENQAPQDKQKTAARKKSADKPKKAE